MFDEDYAIVLTTAPLGSIPRKDLARVTCDPRVT